MKELTFVARVAAIKAAAVDLGAASELVLGALSVVESEAAAMQKAAERFAKQSASRPAKSKR